MGLLSPGWVILGLLVVPIIVLFMVSRSGRIRRVSSIFLWKDSAGDLSKKRFWQLRRPDLLLWLQILMLVFLVLSLARPFFDRESLVHDSVILLIDTSASMKATDIYPSRFSEARRRAIGIVDKLAPDGEMSVISVGTFPKIVVRNSTNKQQIRKAIQGIVPTNDVANLSPALSLVDALWEETVSGEVFLLSDGNLDFGSLPTDFRFKLHYEPIAINTDNVSIGAFFIQGKSNDFVAVTRVSNYSDSVQSRKLEIYLEGALYDVRSVEINPGESTEVTWEQLPLGVKILEVRLSPGDIFAVDDVAWALAPSQGDVKTLLITEGNRVIETALLSQLNVELTKISSTKDLFSEGFDVVVLDHNAVVFMPEVPLLLINPPFGNNLLNVSDYVEVDSITIMDDRLLDFVDLSNLQITQMPLVSIPVNARILVDSSAGPLIALWEENQQRIALFNMDIYDSNLPLSPSFPILIHNILNWLVPGTSLQKPLYPGESVEVSLGSDTEDAEVLTPIGDRINLNPSQVTHTFTQTNNVGVYTLIERTLNVDKSRQFVVNMFMPTESSLSQNSIINAISFDTKHRGDRLMMLSREIGLWLVLGVLILLMAEWWVYNRGH